MLRRATLISSLFAVLVLVVAAPAAGAAPLGLPACAPSNGVQSCSGLVASWDGVPLDTTVVLPEGRTSHLPLVVEINGFGNSKYEYLDPGSTAYTDNAYAWAKAGYAVLTYTARGQWGSCGTPEARLASAVACARGYIHLADVRYEARDAQELIGRLVDDGVADPRRIGVTGDSYGGGQSFDLAALRDRQMLPDGRLVPWRSPAGTPLSLAAVAPVIPWTDLVYAIAPNGRTSATAVTPSAFDVSPVGVFKASIANAIFAAAETAVGPGQPLDQPFVPGRPMGYLAPPGVDPEADVAGWVARSDAGEPYDDQQVHDIIATLERYHSAYNVDASAAPPPLFVGAGFTDDIFPVDETLRFVNRMRRDHPHTPVSLLFGDFGHQRASNKRDVRARLLASIHAWFDRYVRGNGRTPADGVTAMTQTCPRDAASGGPFTAPTFAGLAPGLITYRSSAPQTIGSAAGNPAVAAAIDPVAGGGDDCAHVDAAPSAGAASYRLAPAPAQGETLLGAPAVTAALTVHGQPNLTQIASRLWDVAPDGSTKTLVARGLYRPSGASTDTWQLHPNGWRFERGHVPELELLGNDAPYARPSNSSFTIDVSRLELRLPVHEGAFAPARCVRRRRLIVVIPRVHGHPLHAVRVFADGRRVHARIRGRRRRRITIVVRRRMRRYVRVRIEGRTSTGRALRVVRRYRTCRVRSHSV